MRWTRCVFYSFLGAFLLAAPVQSATIVQKPNTNYLVVEAEDFDNAELNDDNSGWLIIGPGDPQEVQLHDSNPGTIIIPPPNSNPSNGMAIFDQVGGGLHQIGYSLNFATPGAYYLYMRTSVFDLMNLAETSYGNEDSIYLPVESIDQDPAAPELRDSRDGNIDLDQKGVSPLDSCRDFEEPWVIPEDECEADFPRAEISMEGQYHWQNANWSNGLGHVNYDIEQTGVALDFNIATRERGSSLDVLIFSQDPDLLPEDLDEVLAADQGDPCDFDGDGTLGIGDIDALSAAIGGNDTSFDVNGDGAVNSGDLQFFVTDASKLNTWIGDSNLDGEFNSGDLVSMFTAGEYEDGLLRNSTWQTGDFNADEEFDSGDLVAAFTDGGYEQGPRPVNAVPEPTSFALLIAALVGITSMSRSRGKLV